MFTGHTPPTCPYWHEKSSAASPHQLYLGSSGGTGHNAGIGALIAWFLENGFVSKETLTVYKPVLHQLKRSTEKTKVNIGAFFSNNIPLVSKGIQTGLNVFDYPQLPKPAEIKEEIKKLNAEQEKMGQRFYVDMLYDVLPPEYAAVWNLLQRNNKTDELRKLIQLQDRSNQDNYETVYNYFMQLLNKAKNEGKPYTEIISTQAMALPALCDVVRDYNKENKTTVKIHQYMTDLATKGAIHFFGSLSQLTPEQCQQMIVYGVNLEKNFTEIDAEFNLSQKPFIKLINIDPQNNPLVRLGFKNTALKNISPNAGMDIKVVENKKIDGKDIQQEVIYHVKAGEKIVWIMLGGQSGNDTIEYVKYLMRENLYSKIFVFGGQSPHIKTELEKILTSQRKSIPAGQLKQEVILLSPQKPEYFADIIVRGDGVCNTGGLFTMEMLALPVVNPNKIVLFNGRRNKEAEFTSGISWEDENGRELQNFLRGKTQKVTRTCPKEVSYELLLRKNFSSYKRSSYIQPNFGADDGRHELQALMDKINQFRERPQMETFVNGLDALYAQLHDDYLDKRSDNIAISKIRLSPAIQVAEQTKIMLEKLEKLLDSTDVNNETVIMQEYTQTCKKLLEYDAFIKFIAVIVSAALGALIGAVILGLVGAVAGIWTGPGAVATTFVGLLGGVFSGAALGLAAGMTICGITTASISGYLLFKPSKLTEAVNHVAQIGDAVELTCRRG